MQKISQQDNNQMNRAPQPIRGNEGGTDPGPRNMALDRQNPDILTPPSTDAGTIPNLKFSFGLAHNRILAGGWARQGTARELPIATQPSGVNMRLNPGAARELRWHNGAEGAYMLNRRARTRATDQDRHNVPDRLGRDDLW